MVYLWLESDYEILYLFTTSREFVRDGGDRQLRFDVEMVHNIIFFYAAIAANYRY